MLRLIMTCGFLVVVANTQAQTHVNGYMRSNGTYVAPHYRSNADGNTFNNWSSQGNANPYTGQQGTHNSYAPTNSMGSGTWQNTPKTTPNPWGNTNSGWGH
jgi:hypothetical protein